MTLARPRVHIGTHGLLSNASGMREMLEKETKSMLHLRDLHILG
jgi:hypothetical protein